MRAIPDEAIKRGAEPVAPGRGAEFLDALTQILSVANMKFQLITCPAEMGARIAEDAGIDHMTLELPIDDTTSAKDTKSCVLKLYKAGVRLLVFVGGMEQREIF